MYHGNCKCPHHWLTKVLVVLVWLSALGFWWTDWQGTTLWWMDAEHLFRDVVVLGFLAFLSGYCSCCSKKIIGPGTCKHEEGCKCGDCDRCC